MMLLTDSTDLDDARLGSDPPQRAREVSADSFALFLSWLDPEPQRAGEQYTAIQQGLIRMFAARGCEHAEELADETLNRVVQRAAEIVPSYDGNPVAYIHGVAKNVAREQFRRQARARIQPVLFREEAAPEVEHLHACLEHCLQTQLTAQERQLILDYYRVEARRASHRSGLAQRADVDAAALRKRTQRIRQRLQRSLLRCLEDGVMDGRCSH
jgi:DNA-directed RNA polymerase specialized sigma24 family protein